MLRAKTQNQQEGKEEEVMGLFLSVYSAVCLIVYILLWGVDRVTKKDPSSYTEGFVCGAISGIIAINVLGYLVMHFDL